MTTYRQCTLCVAYHSLLEAPLDLEALGLSLYSLLVNPVLATDHPAPHLLRL